MFILVLNMIYLLIVQHSYFNSFQTVQLSHEMHIQKTSLTVSISRTIEYMDLNILVSWFIVNKVSIAWEMMGAIRVNFWATSKHICVLLQ